MSFLRATRYVEFTIGTDINTNHYSLVLMLRLSLRVFGISYFALLGNEKFARCFMTSEYLYQLFMVGNQHCFDYSTVVSGFFKSIEILLEKLMILRLSSADHDTLWIKAKTGKRGYKGNVDGINCRLNPAT